MKIIQSEIQDLNFNLPLKSSIVVVGYFDGLHASHQKLLSLAQKWADQENLKFVLVTFDQKIADFFQHSNHDLISSTVKHQFLKDHYEIDYLVELKVNSGLINMSKNQFLDFLEKDLGVKMMVEGQGFCFGAQCTGKIEDLKKRFGNDQVVVLKRKKAISATKIRQWLAKGKIIKINFWLKRHLELSLSVEKNQVGETHYQLLYPKAKLKAGTYFVFNENQHELSFKINEKQKITAVHDPRKILEKNGIYQLKFKKFLGAKK